MLHLVTAVVCESVSETSPFTLSRVRKKWATPPDGLSIYLEVLNATGSPFDVKIELWRRSTKIADFDYDLILMTRRDREEFTTDILLPPLKPKTYSFHVLLNGILSDTIWVDFGSLEALP